MAKKFGKKKEEDKKMGKIIMRKFNKDPHRTYLIKKLLKTGTSTAEIMKIANCSKQLVSKYRKYGPKPR